MTDQGIDTRHAPADKPQKRELFAWAMYDFANSGYTTVVLTTVFNVYFVGVVASSLNADNGGSATFLWTLAMGIANAIVLLSAPVLGAIADYHAIKKPLLVVTTIGCVAGTALLALAGAGDLVMAMTLVIISNVMFASGENLISAFLPEISDRKNMGRVSGFAWGLGYFGGILSLVLCLLYINWAEGRGADASQYVPVTMLIVAVMFALAALPTFLWLRERAVPVAPVTRQFSLLQAGRVGLNRGLGRVLHTLREASHYRDLFRFLLTLAVYQSGVSTVIVLAAVYAQEVVGLSQQDIILLILVVNFTAALGAVVFGLIQDKLGSIRTLAITLLIWIVAVAVVFRASQPLDMWIAGNLIGLAMGATQSAGRALIGQFTPPARTAEFFGLWGLAMRVAAIVGPVSYGVISYFSGGDHRLALLSTLLFFVVGLLLLLTVDEKRGQVAVSRYGDNDTATADVEPAA
ncbi:MFS transporter [Exilibacterium tricleocarpae]|uniref:MFS transporter n=1 Tax=Exilibacterium tricleocarpae TaxID=2591008 RepID=A0A545U895_9GAMM|nr:MFS transporter [Exilibacterium tricleocarpae]TQV85678.1 MFS transporter [Exilibacterium tricleocarpae]